MSDIFLYMDCIVSCKYMYYLLIRTVSQKLRRYFYYKCTFKYTENISMNIFMLDYILL